MILGDGRLLNASKGEEVELMIESNKGRKRRCVLHDVLFVLELAYNLLSVAKATQDGISVVFNNCECCIYDQDEKSLAKAAKSGRLYHDDD